MMIEASRDPRNAPCENTQTMSSCQKRASALAATALLLVACASGGGEANAYQAFLQKIAADCKPLIIGNDDIGQAIVFNGLGAVPENYNNFLGKTSALYAGSISPAIYQASLTSFIGSGSYNQRSFDCIIAHLPAAKDAK